MLTDVPASAPESTRRVVRMRRALLWGAWAVLVATGFSALIVYEKTPGGAGNPPAKADFGGAEPRGGYTLVMAAHPHCPCSRASLGELTVLMTHLQGRLTGTVWFYAPPEEPADWARSGLWKTAAALPGVTAEVDPEGRMATRLGAETSGHVLLFDPAGRQVFSGGITGGRGHEGDNAGRDAVEALVLGRTTAPVTTPVFGCSIRDEPPGVLVAAGETGAGGR